VTGNFSAEDAVVAQRTQGLALVPENVARECAQQDFTRGGETVSYSVSYCLTVSCEILLRAPRAILKSRALFFCVPCATAASSALRIFER
jgi:hypothetical protein